MKKIFTLIAAATLALGASAQTITWSSADVTKTKQNPEDASKTIPDENINGKTYGSGGFIATVVDEIGFKAAVDANNAYFGTSTDYTKYEYRFKSGGKNGTEAGTANRLDLTIPSAGTLKVCARTGSNSATDRTLVITQNGSELYNKVVIESDAVTMSGKSTKVYPIISVAVEAGTVSLSWPVNSINIYALELVAGEGGGGTEPTPVTPTDPSAAKVWDFTNMSADALAALAANTANWGADVQGTGEEAYTRYTYKIDIAKDTYVDLASIGFSDGAGIEVGRSGGKLAGYAQKEDGSWSGGIRVDANKRLQLNTSNGVFKIKNLAAGDKVTINYQSGSDEARSFSVTNATPATLSAPKNSEEGSIKTETLTVTANGDVTLQQTKAINIFKIALNADMPTAIASVEAATIAAPTVKKYVENGQIVIVKGGKKFNVAGAQIQ